MTARPKMDYGDNADRSSIRGEAVRAIDQSIAIQDLIKHIEKHGIDKELYSREDILDYLFDYRNRIIDDMVQEMGYL